jgi:hypothetical protein
MASTVLYHNLPSFHKKDALAQAAARMPWISPDAVKRGDVGFVIQWHAFAPSKITGMVIFYDGVVPLVTVRVDREGFDIAPVELEQAADLIRTAIDQPSHGAASIIDVLESAKVMFETTLGHTSNEATKIRELIGLFIP